VELGVKFAVDVTGHNAKPCELEQHMSRSVSIPAFIGSSYVRPVLLGWSVFILYVTVQCVAHQAFVSQVAVDLWDSITWTFREWGVWIAVTPVLLHFLRRALHSDARFIAALACLGCLGLALGFRVLLNVLDAQQPLPSLVFFFPKYFGAWLAVSAAGFWLLHGKRAFEQSPPRSAEQRATPRTLLVSKGRDECLINLDQIDSFSASKNYVDVRCNGQIYLVRSTLKQIEEMLPSDTFIRTHRSHIVRISSIYRVRMLASGTGIVTLHDQSTVGLSKKYYRSFEQYRPSVSSSANQPA
jgi:hypothetical protein